MEQSDSNIETLYGLQKIKWNLRDVLISYSIVILASILIGLTFISLYNSEKIDNFMRRLADIFPIPVVYVVLMLLAATPVIPMGLLSLKLVFSCVLKKYGGSILDLGLHGKDFFRNILYGILFAIPLVLFYKILYFYLKGEAIIFFDLNERWYVIISLIIFSGFFSAFWEEVFFIGYIYPALRYKMNYFVAALIVGLLMGVCHIPAGLYKFYQFFIHVFISAFIYEKRKSLVPSIAFHAAYNIFI